MSEATLAAPQGDQPQYPAQQPYQQPQYQQPQYQQPQYAAQGYGQEQYGYQQPYAQQAYAGWPVASGPSDLPMYEVQYPPSLSRGLIFIKWLLAIPHFFVLMLMVIGLYFCTMIAWFAILFTGKYPRGMFEFAVRTLRYASNLNTYLYLLRDEYPPFGGAEGAYPPVQFTLGYSENLSRGLIFIKWLLVIPHIAVLYFLSSITSICVFIAWFAILFTGKFPGGLFNFVVGTHRWSIRTAAYYLLLTDRYPPFTMDSVPASPPAYAPA